MPAGSNGVERAFQGLDRDGDGYVTAQDFEQMARRIIDACGIDETSPKAAQLRAGYRRTFELVLGEMTRNCDGRVGPDEFTSAMTELSGTSSAAQLRGVCAAEFAAADRDDDGVITRAEFARVLLAVGGPIGDVDAAFDALDRDRDGRISRDEYVAAWEEYLVNDNPDSAGARVFAGL